MNNIDTEIIEFKKVLKDLNIELKQNSKLNESLDRLNDYLNFEKTEKKEIVKLKYCPKIISESIFLDKLIPNINRLSNRNDFSKLRNHIALLLDNNVAQNDSKSFLAQIEQEKDNKAWEMFLVIALMNINAEIIYIEDPLSNPDKSNVDIIANIDGIKFGFECKVPCKSPLNARSFLKLIKKGVSQIIESDVDYGIVCLNMMNTIAHEKFLKSVGSNNYECFTDKDEPRKLLKTEIEHNWNEKIVPKINQWFDTKVGNDDDAKIKFIYEGLFQNNERVCKGWINYYSTCSICSNRDGISAQSLQILNFQGITKEDYFLENILTYQINNGFFEKDRNYNLLKYLMDSKNIN